MVVPAPQDREALESKFRDYLALFLPVADYSESESQITDGLLLSADFAVLNPSQFRSLCMRRPSSFRVRCGNMKFVFIVTWWANGTSGLWRDLR